MNKENRLTQEDIEKSLLARTDNETIPCAVAFDLIEKLKISPAIVGECADRLKIKVVKCQLGLFGYHPKKKIVKSSADVGIALKEAIEGALIDARLPCAVAWEIAKNLGVKKMDVSNACESMGIKIKPCQLGAF